MKNPTLSLLFFLTSYFGFAQDKFLEEASLKWQSAAGYTQKVMNTMPQKDFGFKPMKDEMSFEEQLIHMANNMNWLGNFLSNKGGSHDDNIEVKGHSRKEIVQILNLSMQHIQEIINNFDTNNLNDLVNFPDKQLTKRQIITLLNDHQTHHRAQLLVYLRLKGKTPPKYIGW